MKALLIAAMIALGGCATLEPIKPETRTVVKIERLVVPIPSTLLEIPDPVIGLELETIKNDDKAVARWMLESEERTLALELKLRQIRELYIKYLREAKAANEGSK